MTHGYFTPSRLIPAAIGVVVLVVLLVLRRLAG